MSDKNLTELEWKKFSKGRGLKDAAFVKALAALETGKTPEAKLAALDDIDKQADALRKANKADKEIAGYLDDTDKAAAKERKLVEFEAKKAAQKDQGGDDEEETPALLTTKMIPLLRAVRKGDPMKAMVAIAGKDVAVLLSKRSIAPTRRKLLQEFLGVSGGVKFAIGDCIWEENAHTFVLQTAAAGLAKKVKAAVLAQTDMRVKVRVRGEAPDDIDDDGEPAEVEQGESESTEGLKASGAIPEAPPMTATKEEPKDAPATAVADADTTAFNTRLAALMPKVKETIVAAGPFASDVKLKVSEAGMLARKKEFAPAHAMLDDVEKMMGPGAAKPPAPATAPVDAAQYEARLAVVEPRYTEILKANPADANKMRAVFGFAAEQAEAQQYGKAVAALTQLEKLIDAAGTMGAPSGQGYKGIVAYRKSLLELRAAVAKVEGQIAGLIKAIPNQMPDEADLAEELASDLREANEELQDLVDDAMGSAENEDTPITSALKSRLDELIAEIATNAVIKHVDQNPFGVAMNIEATLGKALSGVRGALPVPA
jgi:hypothetical protein